MSMVRRSELPAVVRRSRCSSVALLALVFAAACSPEPVDTEYSDEHRHAFLTACTSSAEDDRLVRDLCECSYEQLAAAMPFADFAAMEESLRIDSLTPLPDHVSELVAECFLDEADL